jgi:hypothetical protein
MRYLIVIGVLFWATAALAEDLTEDGFIMYDSDGSSTLVFPKAAIYICEDDFVCEKTDRIEDPWNRLECRPVPDSNLLVSHNWFCWPAAR